MIEVPEKSRRLGMRLGDQLFLEPVEGRRRRLGANRTKLEVKIGPSRKVEWRYDKLSLKSYSLKNSEWSFELIDDRFLLRSLSDRPFLLNGVPVLAAWPLRGDQVLFDYNLITIRDGCDEEKGRDKCLEELGGRLIQSELPILIEGETGTGKSTLAKKIHEESGVAGNFVALNLRSFNSGLLESELFGHMKGAFTGAVNDKRGAILEAQRGTLFLDEIDSLSIDIQTKLLLFLDSLEFRPVGSERSRKAQVRLIFASGRSLEELVREKKVRSDFFFRLASGGRIAMSSLRGHPVRIREHIRSFEQRNHICFEESLIDYYCEYPWPGNFRQLEGHLKRKYILRKGARILFSKEDKELFSMNNVPLLKKGDTELTISELKIQYAWSTYLKYEGNLYQTSRVLGISKNTLKKLIKEKTSIHQQESECELP